MRKSSTHCDAGVFLVLFEKWYGWMKGNDTVRQNDMISSLSAGVANVTKDVLGLSVVIISYPWILGKIAFVQVQATWAIYPIAFIALDFASYWVHRISHEVNFFLNNHITHHSSEEFNLACAPSTKLLDDCEGVCIVSYPRRNFWSSGASHCNSYPIHLFAQFWYHTQHIGRMGILEKIIVTPSHHRVHHAINPEYLDKTTHRFLFSGTRCLEHFRRSCRMFLPCTE